MISKIRSKINWDLIGIGISIFCAVHCLFLPLLLTSLPFLGIEILENKTIEAGVLLFSLITGFLALWGGYKKYHHQIWIPVLFILGFLLLIASNFFTISSFTETVLKLIALPLVISAHVFNWHHTRNCGKCNI